MIPATSTLFYEPMFNDFLYAPVDAGVNGNPLSVLSAFARLGIDPWKEAAELAGMPKENAQRRLAGLLERLPSRPWVHADSGAIAHRLLQLLPHAGLAGTVATQARHSKPQVILTPLLMFVISASVVIYLIALSMQN